MLFKLVIQRLFIIKIDFKVASLQQKIVAEDKAVEQRTTEFLAEWERSKPTGGSTRPEDALQRLQIAESRYARLKDERDNVAKAKEALELHDSGMINNISDAMFPLFYFDLIRCF